MKLKHTQLQIILEIAGAALIAATVLYMALGWKNFPNRVPVHFDAAGNATSWGTKDSLLFLPMMGFGLYTLITVITFFPSIWNMRIRYREENKTAVYQVVKTMVMALKIELLACFLYIFVYMSGAQSLPPYFLPVFLAVLLGSILLFLLHARKVGNQ